MPRKRWVKLWTQEWISGTTRWELEPDERSIFADFLAMAGDSPEQGKICYYPGVPVTRDQLCKALNVSMELLDRAIDKMVRVGKIKLNDDIVHVINFERYQSEYERTRKYTRKTTKKSTRKSTTTPSVENGVENDSE